jgi:hypothetical protein
MNTTEVLGQGRRACQGFIAKLLLPLEIFPAASKAFTEKVPYLQLNYLKYN